jgi:small subunit ribosomal protein S20
MQFSAAEGKEKPCSMGWLSRPLVRLDAGHAPALLTGPSQVDRRLFFISGSNRQPMANNSSARKRIRQTEKRTVRNKARKSRVRSFLRKVEEAVKSGDKAAAQEAFRAAQPEMQRAATKGVLHANTVARRLSRLSARVKSVGA